MPRKKGQIVETNPKRNWCFKVKTILEGADLVSGEIGRAHRYANTLIELERGSKRQDAVPYVHGRRREIDDALERHHPGWKALKAEYAAAWEAKNEAETPEERKDAKARFSAAEKVYLPVKRALFADPAVKADLKAIDVTCDEAIKRARAARGCYWGTGGLVEQSLRAIRSGAPPEFHRWDYEGAVGCQIQGGMTWAEALACQDPRLRIAIESLESRLAHTPSGRFLPPPNPASRRSREQCRAIVSLRVQSDDAGGPVWAKLFVNLHRQPPLDTRIKVAQLLRRMVGRRVCWELMLTLSRPEWKRVRGEDGAVDITIPAQPTETPEGLLVATAVGSDGREHQLVLPHAELSRWEHIEGLQANRDDNFNTARDHFADWLQGRGVVLASADGTENVADQGRPEIPGWLRGEADDEHPRPFDVRYVRRWRSPDKLSSLVWYWRNHRFPADRAIFPLLEAWRSGSVQDDGRRHGGERHYHDWQDHERRQASRWRDERLRRFADILARTYRVAWLPKVDYAAARRTRRKGEGRGAERTAKLHAAIASPGRLYRYVCEAFGLDPKHGNPRPVESRAATC